MKASLPVLVVAAVSLAACLQPGATVDPNRWLPLELPLDSLADIVVENLTLERPDGAKLAMTVFRPQTDEKVPVLAAISPYFNSGSTTWILNAPDRRLAEYFLPHGYAFAQVALRGTGDSTGCFSIGGADEQEDAAAIVDFLGEQEWTNGKVALIGKSYVGTTPWEAAILQPKHLAAIVPISGITDMYDYMFYNGTILYPWGAHFLMYYGADEDLGVQPLAPLGAFGLLGDDKVGALEATLNDAVVPAELTRSVSDHASCPHFRELLLEQYTTDVSGDHGAFWDERDYRSRLDQVQVPVFLIHGWQDWNVKPDHVAYVWEKLDVPKVAWFGQWNHDYPDINRHNADWSRHDYNATLLAFFEQTLKGVDTGIFDRPAVETQDQLGNWRQESSWPPATMRYEAWTMGDGRLGPDVAPAGAVRFAGTPTARPGPDNPMGSVVFESEPFAADVRLAGIPRVDLTITPMQAGGHVVVVLYNVTAEGQWTVLDAGFLDLRHAESRDASQPVVPGQPMTIRVEMYPQDLLFRKGERLALAIAGEMPADPAEDALEGWVGPGPIYPWPTPTSYVLDTEGATLLLPVVAAS